jgi:hypothetical protein
MKKTVVWILGMLLLLLAGCTASDLALNEFNFVCPVGIEGIPSYEPTVENIINRFSTHVVTGSITGFEDDPFGRSRHYYFDVNSVIIGELEQDSIIILGAPGLLSSGTEYMLFLREYRYTHWDFTPYQVADEFVLVIYSDGILKRLENPLTQSMILPFVDSNYNNLAELSSYVIKTRNEAVFRKHNPYLVHFIESTVSLEELYELSDMVMEINVTAVERTNSQTAACQFKVLQIYKGNHPKTNFVALPGKTTEGTLSGFLGG